MPDPVVTPHQNTPAQNQQAAEAAAQAANRVPGGETQVALEGVSDGSPQDPSRGQQPQIRTPEPPPSQDRAPPKIDTRGNRTRNDIVSRFRTEREAEKEAGDEDELSDFTQEGLPPEFAAEPEAQAEPQAEPQQTPPAPGPTMVRVKVRGVEKEVPLEEALAMAQKSYAADEYLDEAKKRLESAKNLENEIRAQRAGSNGTHPAGQDGVHPATPQRAPGAQTQDDPQHPEGKKLIESIQFGDPEEAERLLQEEITRRTSEQVGRAVDERLMQQRLRDEGARAAAQLKEFAEKHKDIAEDPASRAVMEVNTLALQKEDLRKLGLDPDSLRTDGVPTTPGDIAEAHRYYRANGYAVRTPAQLLEDSFEKYQEWRGVKKTQQTDTPAQPTQQAAPRVELTVARQERRQSVQPQPSRTAQPRVARQPEPVGDRSSIVQKMKAQRALKRGAVLGA